MPTADIKDVQGQRVGSVTLTEPVFVKDIQKPLLWQSVKAYLANRRQGTAKTRTRGDGRGGGRKPWKQKGTGRARQSSIRSPLWRGGGVVFGPHPRDYRVHQPQAVRRQALLSSLEAKWQDGAVTIVKTFTLEAPKTKQLAQALKALGVQGRALVLVDAPDPLLARAAVSALGAWPSAFSALLSD